MRVKIDHGIRWWFPSRIMLPFKWLLGISDDDYYGISYPEPTTGVVDRLKATWIGQWLEKKSFNAKVTKKVDVQWADLVDGDATLAMIIHPFLVKFKAEHTGIPMIDANDLPPDIQALLSEYRWNWILNEMIFAFKNVYDHSESDQYYSGEVDWVFDDNGIKHGPNHTFSVDKKALTEHEERIARGLLLFGKYMRALWI